MYRSPFLLYELSWLNQPSRYHDLEPTLQRLFLDNFLDDYLEDLGQVSVLLDFGISLSFLQLLLKRNNPIKTSVNLLTRLSHLRQVAASCSWEAEEIYYIFPEARSLDVHNGMLAYSRNIEGSALFHSFAMGMAGNFTRKSCHPNPDQWAESRKLWKKLLLDSIRLDHLSLHHLDTTSHWSIKNSKSSALVAAIKSVIGAHPRTLSTAEQVCKSMVATISEWVTILSSSDVDLLHYGREERHMYEQGLTTIWQRWAPWKDGTIGRTRFCLIGITYGSCPSHWRLWWTYEYEDYAGEFWDMIQDEASKVPGAWVDDSWDLVDYDDEEWNRWETWEKEQPTPLIWSEYRRVRPPL